MSDCARKEKAGGAQLLLSSISQGKEGEKRDNEMAPVKNQDFRGEKKGVRFCCGSLAERRGGPPLDYYEGGEKIFYHRNQSRLATSASGVRGGHVILGEFLERESPAVVGKKKVLRGGREREWSLFWGGGSSSFVWSS